MGTMEIVARTHAGGTTRGKQSGACLSARWKTIMAACNKASSRNQVYMGDRRCVKEKETQADIQVV